MKNLCFYFILCLLFLQNCATSKFKNIQNGDLIFVTAKTENLSGAISRVTKDNSQVSFDHIGIIAKNGKGFFVYHAAPKGGSQKQSLDSFLENIKKEKASAYIYRLKTQFRNSIPKAISVAEKMVGKPYNFTYILDENSSYCSDFVERAFRDDHIFNLIPMNFKNLETGKIDDYWVVFYKKLGKEVPQDLPGTNPNQLSKSEKLEFVKVLN